MRSIGLIGALVIAAPLAAQSNKFRTDDVLTAAKNRTEAAAAAARSAQDPRRDNDRVPPGQLPPAGMCRIWIDGVPPGQQPAPTDCQTAVATKPANARVLWGDQSAFPGKGKGKSKLSGKGRGSSGQIGRDGNDDDRDQASVLGSGRRGDDDNDDVNENRGSGLSASRSIAKSANKGSGSSHGRHKGDD